MIGELELQLARARRAYEDAKRAGFKADGSPGSALNTFKPESYEAEIRECERMLAEARQGADDTAMVSCKGCRSGQVMSDTPRRGVCNACGFAWDDRPGGFASDFDSLNDWDEGETGCGPCKECGWPRTRSGLCPKCD